MPFLLSRRSPLFGVTLLAAITVGAVPSPAAADGTNQPPVPQLIPQSATSGGYFDYSLAAGQSGDGAVMVKNPSTASATFALYPTDATTSSATGVVYGGLGATPQETGTWLHLPSAQLTLGPGQSQTVPFTVTVPATAGPGDHVAGIAAQNPQSTSEAGAVNGPKGVGVALDVSTRVVVAVVVHVAGPAQAGLSFGAPGLHAENGNRQVVDIPMRGTGQVLIKPHLTLSLRACHAPAGPALATLDRQLDTFVPGSSIVYEWPLGTLVLAPGCYEVSAVAGIGANELARVHGSVSVTAAQAAVHPQSVAGPAGAARHHRTSPWRLVVVMGAIALALLVLVVALMRSRRRSRALEAQLARLAGSAPQQGDPAADRETAGT